MIKNWDLLNNAERCGLNSFLGITEDSELIIVKGYVNNCLSGKIILFGQWKTTYYACKKILNLSNVDESNIVVRDY